MQLAIVQRRPSNDLDRLRQAVQGTLTMAHALRLISDKEMEEIANGTIEAMPPEHLAKLARSAMAVYELLKSEALRRHH
jgi:hypothetical protein